MEFYASPPFVLFILNRTHLEEEAFII